MDPPTLVALLFQIGATILTTHTVYFAFSLYLTLRTRPWLYFLISPTFLFLALVLLVPVFLLGLWATWWSYFMGVFLTLGIVFMGISMSSIYRTLKTSTTLPALLKTAPMGKVPEISSYVDLVNTLNLHLKALSGLKPVKTIYHRHCGADKLFAKVFQFRSGVIKTAKTSGIESGDVPSIFSALSGILADTFSAITAVTSSETASEVLEKALNASLKKHGSWAYKMAMPLLLYARVVDPVLKKCRKKNVSRIAERIAGEGFGKFVSSDRKMEIKLDVLYDEISKLSLEEGIARVIEIFSVMVKSCYYEISATRVFERSLCKAVCRLLETYPILREHELTDLLPPETRAPIQYRLLKPSQCCLVEEEKPKHSFEIFEKLVNLGTPALLISQTHPPNLKKEYALGNSQVLWLSKEHMGDAVPPTGLDIIRDRILEFCESSRGVVFLDGLDYLASLNGFKTTLVFLKDVYDIVILKRARMIVSVNPKALDKKELLQFEHIFENVVKEGEVP